MDYQLALDSDLKQRCIKLQQAMQKMNMECSILSTSVNIFYMTGHIYNGYFYLPAEGDPIHFIKRPNGINLPNTVYIRKPEQIAEELKKSDKKCPKNILLEIDILPYTEITRLMVVFGINEIKGNASILLRKIRSTKSPFELSQIRHCANIHAKVYQEIPNVYKKGMTDIQFQVEIEHIMRQNGSIGIFRSYGMNMDIFMGSLLTGDNAESPSPFDFALGGNGTNATLPLGASGNPIDNGQTIMVDMAGNYTPWMTDMSRIFSVGHIPELAHKAHMVSLDIQSQIMHIARPDVTCAELYNKALEIVKRENLEEYFMGTKQQAKFIGHGLGLEINEPPVLTPRSKEVLEQNIVFALEPKFVLPHIGAVGIENTFVITETGIDKITICNENIISLA